MIRPDGEMRVVFLPEGSNEPVDLTLHVLEADMPTTDELMETGMDLQDWHDCESADTGRVETTNTITVTINGKPLHTTERAEPDGCFTLAIGAAVWALAAWWYGRVVG